MYWVGINKLTDTPLGKGNKPGHDGGARSEIGEGGAKECRRQILGATSVNMHFVPITPVEKPGVGLPVSGIKDVTSARVLKCSCDLRTGYRVTLAVRKISPEDLFTERLIHLSHHMIGVVAILREPSYNN